MGVPPEVMSSFVAWARDPVHASVFQPGVSLHQCPSGMIGWQSLGRETMVLGPPLAPSRDHAKEVLIEFLGQHRRPIFNYVTGNDLDDLGAVAPGRFRSIPMGLESFVDLRKPPCMHPAVVSAERKALKAGLSIEPVTWPQLSPQEAKRVRQINDEWIARSRLGCELRFLNRPMMYAADPGRLFVIRLRDDIVGFLVVDPYVDNGAPSWMLNLIRFEPLKVWGVYLAVVRMLHQILAAEGAHKLSLGLSPLLFNDPSTTRQQPLLSQAILRALIPLRNRLYDFRGIDRYKGWLAHSTKLRYVAAPRGLMLTAMQRMLAVHGISWSLLWRRSRAQAAAGSSRRISSTAWAARSAAVRAARAASTD